MRIISLIVLWIFGATFASAQKPTVVSITQEIGSTMLRLSWTSRFNYNYLVEMSPDLHEWVTLIGSEPGIGATRIVGFERTTDKFFYRVKTTVAPDNEGFLILPKNLSEVDLVNGVRFSFNLKIFQELPTPTTPTKITLNKRVIPNGTWEPIGAISDITSFTDFYTYDEDAISSIKFIRGSTVWIAETTGDYEVQAIALDVNGVHLGSAIRQVKVVQTPPPTITILNAPPTPTTPSTSAQPAGFKTIVAATPPAKIRRVDFFDNGILIGSDVDADGGFGDVVTNREAELVDLLKGTHSITANVYDSLGRVGSTATPTVIQITGGSSRPLINVTSAPDNQKVTAGDIFNIEYTATNNGGPSITGITATDLTTGQVIAYDNTPPFTALSINTTDFFRSGNHTIKVTSRNSSGIVSYPYYFSIFLQTELEAQFANNLVQYMVGDPNANPTNARFTGVIESSGKFEDGFNSGLQINEGVLLTTGLLESWNQGNKSQYYSKEWGQPGSVELENRVAERATNDAAILEFDMYCKYSNFEIEYQFATEEYNVYVNGYNDAFMVEVDGTVISLTPNALDFTGVRSINTRAPLDLENTYLYIGNPFGQQFGQTDLFMNKAGIPPCPPGVNPSDTFSCVPAGNEYKRIGYDGMTIRLKARAFIKQNTTHHIRIIIADVKDQQLDAALFLKKASIRTTESLP